MMNAVELTRELIAVESTNPGMGESDMEDEADLAALASVHG